MAKNKGKGTEEWVSLILKGYENRGIATIEKVDPPTLTVRPKGGPPRTINLANPFLDYFGTWTSRAARAVCFEVKHTEEPVLRVCRSGGITQNQWEALLRWERAGAATFVLWEYGGRFRVVTTALIEQALREKERLSLPWSHAIRINGDDFLGTVEHLT